MEKVSVSRLKNQLSVYLRKVRGGQTVLVTDRNKPIASLQPVVPLAGDAEWITRLVELGIASAPKAPPISIEQIRRIRPTAPGANLLEALLEERESGR